MNKHSQVRFRPGSRLPANLGVAPDSTGTVLCKYMISNPIIGFPERIDVCFDGNRVVWGVPIAEFVLADQSEARTGSRAA